MGRPLRQVLALTAWGGGLVSLGWTDDGPAGREALEYEHQRAVGHAAMPSTMYASSPAESAAPHAAMSTGGNLWERLAGSGTARWRLFHADDETAGDVFRDHISPVVQAKCVTCHVEGGASSHTRLVFETSQADDHEAHNLGEFEDFVDQVTGGADLILAKIRGVGHGGGEQVPVDSDDYGHFERFVGLLQNGGAAELTAETLFDTVRMASPRKTLRRATLIFAGRIPTQAEYDTIAETGLRAAIRSVMEGDAFHDFLIRGANDRLLTDNTVGSFLSPAALVDYNNGRVQRCEIGNAGSGDFGYGWASRANQAARRAPLELIAHVARNDLPYTEILTADYVMANPYSAEAYGADTDFDDIEDPHEFKPSTFAAYYLRDGSRTYDETADCGNYITDPGELRLDYPHAGVLNTTAFLLRFPTTATNRNRARARWTYYHFLGVDVEQLAARTTDADALADTDNPTMKNPACTGCHGILDPMAGAFQNYDERGHYRSNWGGKDSLDYYYRNNPPAGEETIVEARSPLSRQTVSIRKRLAKGDNVVGLAMVRQAHWTELRTAGLTVRDDRGRLVARPRLTFQANQGYCADTVQDGMKLKGGCAVAAIVDIPVGGFFTAMAEAWALSWRGPAPIKIWAGHEFYREGDTWYRDMRAPGFEDAMAPNAADSVRWLAQRVAADPRFAEATVKFWWPAIMGTDVAAPPEEAGEVDHQGRLLAARAQQAEVLRLGGLFRGGIGEGQPYSLKDLLVEIVMSPWFRADTVFDDDPVRAVALRDAGARRLLTPEELAAKTLSLTGVQWGRFPTLYLRRFSHALTREYAVLYGGTGPGVDERARDLSPVMAGVSKLHAVRVSCPVVLREFYLLPEEDRRLFDDMDPMAAPSDDGGEAAIKEKLVDLFGRLLGVDATTSSPDIVAAYDLFLDVLDRKGGSNRFLDGALCEWDTDLLFLADLPPGALGRSNLHDPSGIARTWVVVLAALLMDPRYIHL